MSNYPTWEFIYTLPTEEFAAMLKAARERLTAADLLWLEDFIYVDTMKEPE